MNVEIRNGEIIVDAQLLGDLLDVPASDVPGLMRARAITSLCERGVEAHAGQYRLSFFYQKHCARLSIDGDGNILRRSSIEIGERRQQEPRQAPGG